METRINALERLKFGVTCIYTQLGGNGTRTDDARFTEVVADELEAIGLRTRIGLAPARPPWPRPYSYWERRQADAEARVVRRGDRHLRHAS